MTAGDNPGISRPAVKAGRCYSGRGTNHSVRIVTLAQRPLLAALDHLAAGDWQAAHVIVQEDESVDGCWLHAIVHVLEGDVGNARYWYGRAGRKLSLDAAAEIAAARRSIT